MKKIIKAVIISVFVFFCSVFNANALENDSELKTEYIDKVYAYHYKRGILMSYGKLPFRYQNGKLSYCIEPWKVINTKLYTSTNDWTQSGYTDEEKRQMELISHYGYGYEGHNTVRYYMATQELIWLFKDDYVRWTTSLSDGAEEINVENEKNEILNLVNKHNVMPSFTGRCYSDDYGKTLVLEDINNVLDNYVIDTSLNYDRNNNSITIKLNRFGSNKILFRTKGNNNETLLFRSKGVESQSMVFFGFNDFKESELSINVDKVKVRINKRDSETKDLIKEKGTIFKVKDVNTGEYINEYLEVNDGYAIISLPKGKYELEEINASNGYVINKENQIFEINDNITLNNEYYDIDVFNSHPKGEINVLKVNEDNIPLEGVEIGLYDSNFKMIKTYKTDVNGKITISDLDLETYYLKEISTLEGYILDNEYKKVELKYKDDKSNIVTENIKITNEKVKCDVVYITSSNDGTILPNVEINVYDENNNIVYNGKTNSEGKITIEKLPYGKYYIKQIKVPSGYILNEEIVYFSVNDMSCLSDIKVTNEKSIMPVTSSSSNILLNIFPFAIIGILFVIKKIMQN